MGYCATNYHPSSGITMREALRLERALAAEPPEFTADIHALEERWILHCCGSDRDGRTFQEWLLFTERGRLDGQFIRGVTRV